MSAQRPDKIPPMLLKAIRDHVKNAWKKKLAELQEDDATEARKNQLKQERDAEDKLISHLEKLGDVDVEIPTKYEYTTIPYKTYRARGSLLHFAAFFNKADDIEHLLSNKADINKVATYSSKNDQNKTITCSIEAIHIAIASGSANAVDALLRKDPNLVTRCTLFDGQNHAYPLHDAVWFQSHIIVENLLQNRADPNASNRDRLTALHLVARVGRDAKVVESIISDLKEAGADFGREDPREVSVSGNLSMLAGKTPLMIAANPKATAGFPRKKLHLLAPSWQGKGNVLDDLHIIARVSSPVAEEFTKQLKQKQCPNQVVIGEAEQNPKQTLQQLLRVMMLAPVAGVDILEMLTAPPDVEDLQHNPPPVSANLLKHGVAEHLGLVHVWPRLGHWLSPSSPARMRCAYVPDCCKKYADDEEEFLKSNRKKVPQWRKSKQQWHENITGSHLHKALIDVELKTVRLPNVMGYRLLRAITEADIEVLSSLTVEGIIQCLWHGVIQKVHYFHMILELLSIWCLMYWALGLSGYESKYLFRASWNLLAAITWQELFTMTRGAYVSSFFKTRKGAAHHETPFAQIVQRGATELGDVCCSLLLMLLVIPTGFQVGWCPIEHLSTFRSLIALNVVARFFKCLYLLRGFEEIGEHILALLMSCFSGNVIPIFCIGFLVFLAFSCGFVVLRDGAQESTQDIVMLLFKAALLADGEAVTILHSLHHDAPDSIEADVIGFLTICVVLIFTMIILNLMIAVYGSEYNRAEQQSKLLWLDARATISVRCLSRHLIDSRPLELACTVWQAIPRAQSLQWHAQSDRGYTNAELNELSEDAASSLGGRELLTRSGGYEENVRTRFVLPIFGHLNRITSCLPNVWCGKEKSPWWCVVFGGLISWFVCYLQPLELVKVGVAPLFLAAGQVAFCAALLDNACNLMADDEKDSQGRRSKDNFVWICHRSELAVARPDTEKRMDEFDQQLKSLNTKLDHVITQMELQPVLNAKLDHIIKQLVPSTKEKEKETEKENETEETTLRDL